MADEQPTTAAVETHRFQAEVAQLLHLVVHSLYSHKEIFLRELISNASDALDRLKFLAITKPELLADAPALEIRLVPDRERGTLTIEDNGIGMTHDEMTRNLGTIAHSGSRAFLEQLAARGDKDKNADVNLIGQFGVGFYSAWLVADRVEVVSRAAESTEAWRFASDAKESFTLSPDTRASRGTSVVLHLAADQKEYLEPWRLRDLVARYSDYVGHPIRLVEKPDAEPQTINRANALWQRARNEITDAQYDEFYQHVAHDTETPLARSHFKVEGQQQFVGLLFVPRRPPFDLHIPNQRRGIRLFVRRVFIMDNAEELVPNWLRFIRGVVDSDDLPLNVSRELLQDSAIVRAIRNQVVRKSIEMLESLAKDKRDDYKTFWSAFGPVVKEGLATDFEHRAKIAQLVRYASTKEPFTSLAEYVARMPEGQKAIYYVVGESQRAIEDSPHLETLRKRGYEVLFMTDPVDEWAADALGEFEGKNVVSAMRADLELGEADEPAKDEAKDGSLDALIEKIRGVLGDRVGDVRRSSRLTDSPCCLVVPEGASHAYLERLLRDAGRSTRSTKHFFEINPQHPLIEQLGAMVKKDPTDAKLVDWIEVLYEQALLTEGSRLEDPNRFARRVTALLTEVARNQRAS